MSLTCWTDCCRAGGRLTTPRIHHHPTTPTDHSVRAFTTTTDHITSNTPDLCPGPAASIDKQTKPAPVVKAAAHKEASHKVAAAEEDQPVKHVPQGEARKPDKIARVGY